MIVSTKEQKDILREGGAHLARILKILGEMARPGVSTKDLDDEARRLMAECGGQSGALGYTPGGSMRPYPGAICTSINHEIVHGIPNENPKILQNGDIISIDGLLKYKGLITDSCITVGVGEISKEDMRLIRAAREARSAAIAVARVGNTTGDIGHVIAQVVQKYGYTAPPELGGHGVGNHVHEDPFIPNYGTPGKGEKLKDGMVLAIEPIVMAGSNRIMLESDGYTYSSIDGHRSAQFEHTVIITKKGAEIVTGIV